MGVSTREFGTRSKRTNDTLYIPTTKNMLCDDEAHLLGRLQLPNALCKLCLSRLSDQIAAEHASKRVGNCSEFGARVTYSIARSNGIDDPGPPMDGSMDQGKYKRTNVYLYV